MQLLIGLLTGIFLGVPLGICLYVYRVNQLYKLEELFNHSVFSQIKEALTTTLGLGDE